MAYSTIFVRSIFLSLTLWPIERNSKIDEFLSHLNKLKNHKAAGPNGVPAEALKNLDISEKELLHSYITDVWTKHANYDDWHEALLACVPKSGDLSNPNKWRGICLLDVLSKVFSAIINGRLHKALKKYGIETQNGSTPGRGCADRVFSLKSALHSWKQHQLPSQKHISSNGHK